VARWIECKAAHSRHSGGVDGLHVRVCAIDRRDVTPLTLSSSGQPYTASRRARRPARGIGGAWTTRQRKEPRDACCSDWKSRSASRTTHHLFGPYLHITDATRILSAFGSAIARFMNRRACRPPGPSTTIAIWSNWIRMILFMQQRSPIFRNSASSPRRHGPPASLPARG